MTLSIKIIRCLTLVGLIGLGGFCLESLAADDTPAKSKATPQEKAAWYVISFPSIPSATDKRAPSFSLYRNDADKGLDLHVYFTNPVEPKDLGISASLYRENGTVIPSAGGNLDKPTPTPVTVNPTVPGGFMPTLTSWHVQTLFPWAPNVLEAAWIKVTLGQESYWLELPYGFDRNPLDPLAPAVPEGKEPRPISALLKRGTHDHVVPWESVAFDFGKIQNGWDLTLVQSNPGDGESEITLYREKGGWDLHSPRTSLRGLDADGDEIGATCVTLHLEDGYRRKDSFNLWRRPDNARDWGQIEIKVEDKTYRVTVPSSLFKFGHGHVELK